MILWLMRINRVLKTSPTESHTGDPAPRVTSLLNHILVGRRDDDDKQQRFQQALMTTTNNNVFSKHGFLV